MSREFSIEVIREAVKNLYRARFENWAEQELRLTELFVAVGIDPADPLDEDKT